MSGETHSFLLHKGGIMKEKLIEKVGKKLENLNVFVDDVYIVEEAKEKTLTIVLDSKDMIDLKTVVKATRILNPIVDELDFIQDAYTLDVYAKEKGDGNNEQ